MSNIESESLVPLADTDEVGLGIGRRTIGRRIKNPPNGFPTVLRINRRLYVRRSELENFKQRLITEALLDRKLGIGAA
jgi:hypothetical protein